QQQQQQQEEQQEEEEEEEEEGEKRRSRESQGGVFGERRREKRQQKRKKKGWSVSAGATKRYLGSHSSLGRKKGRKEEKKDDDVDDKDERARQRRQTDGDGGREGRRRTRLEDGVAVSGTCPPLSPPKQRTASKVQRAECRPGHPVRPAEDGHQDTKQTRNKRARGKRQPDE
ncbi:hypothetical protein TRV_07984, partial [Trichophyton verrucosum HKI 0517]